MRHTEQVIKCDFCGSKILVNCRRDEFDSYVWGGRIEYSLPSWNTIKDLCPDCLKKALTALEVKND